MFTRDLNYYLFLILAVGILSAGFHSLGFVKLIPWHLVYSDTLGFFDRASAPGFPYISKQIEYPVLTGFFIQFSDFLGKTRLGYYLVSVAGLIILAVIATYFLLESYGGIFGLPVEDKTDSRRSRHIPDQILLESKKKKLLKYWILAPSMIVFLTSNWDILAITLIVAALYFFQKEKFYPRTSGGGTGFYWGVFLLSLGFSAKFYPILYFFPLLLKKNRWQDWVKIFGIFAVTTAVLNGFFAFYHFNVWNYFYTLNSSRDPNPDSVWTAIRYFVYPMEVGAVNWLSLILFGTSYFYFIWRCRRESLIKLFAVATFLFIIFNKIFSPQYLLWLLPFFVLLPEVNDWLFYGLEFSNLAVFFSILPWFFLGHNIFYFYLATPFVLIRHILLLIIFFKVLAFKDRKNAGIS